MGEKWFLRIRLNWERGCLEACMALSFLVHKSGMIIPSSQDCYAVQKDHICEVLGKVWMQCKLKVVVLHKLGYSPKRVIIVICGFSNSECMKTTVLSPQTDFLHPQYHEIPSSPSV